MGSSAAGTLSWSTTTAWVVVPLEDVKQVAITAARRLVEEQDKRDQFAAGALSLDLYGLRQKLEELGVTYVDA